MIVLCNKELVSTEYWAKTFIGDVSQKGATLLMGIPDLIQARKWLDSKDWETEIKGIDIIVTLARKDPDVSFIKIWKHEAQIALHSFLFVYTIPGSSE